MNVPGIRKMIAKPTRKISIVARHSKPQAKAWGHRHPSHPATGQGAHASHRNTTAALIAAILLVVAPVTLGQTAPGMDGRALDANPQLGSGGLNTPVQQRLFNTANLYVTGNVTGGRAFQGFSPVRDTSSLYLGLPSTRLSRFQRDSFGASDIARNRSFTQTNPFFFPSQTVTNTGAITARRNLPGTSIPQDPYLVPRGRSFGTGAWARPSAPDITFGFRASQTVVPNSSLYTPENTALLRDTDLARRLRMSSQTDALRQPPQYGQSITQTRDLFPPSATVTGTLHDPYALSRANVARTRAPFVRRTRLLGEGQGTPTSEDMLANSRRLLSPTSLAPRLFGQDRASAKRDPLTGRPLPEPPAYLATPQGRTFDPVAARDRVSQTASTLIRSGLIRSGPSTGEHLIYGTGSQQGEGLATLPQTVEWLTDFSSQPDARDQLEMFPALRTQYDQAIAAVKNATSHTVVTFADSADSRVTDYIVRAEQEMRAEQYYRAASLYRLATDMDPSDALVRLGYAHALIAAGEYVTATLHLKRAIEGYPTIGLLRLDLNTFVGDPEILDLRRADLERRLEKKEDYELRFLLGYIEVFSGFKKFGMPDLRKAAAAAPEDSIIRRFPDMLTIEERLTLPDSPSK